ncbi:hypothetical protein CH373_04250 [Leptospira perolatii]|uniref:Membrane protein 6-pyruvoyl-tetrahydropterin synthase-related domain-containing protein n=1 Tax=Leptospira perolatii TaxID=2023191 RepID=A0A2M9ZQ89_9LEPT|nr:hypothetical protein [Leptospira perolatii]PJZ68992.1 hypothetical protein CH360_13080 [Leptospira perolatii]PJZ74139.1 hypothetical protein CH373_04250 [Leptospira perolatii]
MSSKKWKVSLAWRRPLLLLVSFVVIIVKFRFLLTSEYLSGWSLQAQTHLAETYNSLLSNGHSLGYDTSWFSGLPVFFFEPPFFYFVVAFLNKALLFWAPFALSFNVGILVSILLFTYAFVKLSLLLLSETSHKASTVILAMSGLLFFFLCAGEEPFGLSLVGLFSGSVTGFFGLSWSLLGFYYLEKYRTTGKLAALAKYFVVSACVFYSDFPSSLFYIVSLVIYFLFLGDELGKRAFALVFFVPLLLASPVWWNFLKYSSYRAETFPMDAAPGLISILGPAALKPLWEGKGLLSFLWNMIIGLHWIQVVFPVLFILGIRYILKRRIFPPASRFVFFSCLIFYWMGVDSSLSKFFPGIGFPWYRALDLSLVFLTLSALETALYIWKNSELKSLAMYSASGLLVLALFRFFLWHPELEWKEKSAFLKDTLSMEELQEVESALAGLPSRSKIFPEVDSKKKWGDSPFTLGLLIQRAGQRNALGMEADATLSSLVIQPYLNRYLPWTAWGRQKIFEEDLSDSEIGLSVHRFMQANGIDYIIGTSSKLRKILHSNPSGFREVNSWDSLYLYQVSDTGPQISSLAEKPWAVADYKELMELGKFRPKRFLATVNDFILERSLDPRLVFVRLGRNELDMSKQYLGDWFEGIIVLQTPNEKNNWRRELATKFGNLRFVTSAEFLEKIDMSSVRKSDTAKVSVQASVITEEEILSKGEISGSEGALAKDCILVRRSFFPKWEEENGGSLFQTQRNEILTCSKNTGFHLKFAKGNSILLTLTMFLLPIFFLLSSFVRGRWFFR